MELEDCLIILIAVIVIYMAMSLLFKLDPLTTTCVLGGAVLGSAIPIKDTERPDNVKTVELNPVELAGVIGGKHQNYDEYDDESTLKEIDPKMVKSFDNIVIDGTNFLYRYLEYSSGKSASNATIKERLDTIKKMVKLNVKHFPDKNLYFVFKDPENDHQEKELLKELKVDTVKQAHKKFFKELADEYSKVRFVVAYGDAKYRDDYAAIWLADTLPDETILLSRDRYKDVADMESAKLRFSTYGKRASQINKIINKPFNFINKGSFKSTLVGYSFSKKKISGFYDRVANKKSAASDSVYIFKT